MSMMKKAGQSKGPGEIHAEKKIRDVKKPGCEISTLFHTAGMVELIYKKTPVTGVRISLKLHSQKVQMLIFLTVIARRLPRQSLAALTIAYTNLL